MSAHSEKGPSSSDRWIHCTPSAKLCADMPETTSGFAKEGTEAHSLCEYLLNAALGKFGDDPTADMKYYNEEMREHALAYRDYVLEMVEAAQTHCSDPIVLVEQRVEYERFVKGGFGTADCVIIADGTLNVIDFKYGTGVEVSAVNNSQMRIYALGALEIFDALYDIDRVQMTIYQPRLRNISVDEISRDELYNWAETVLKPAAEEAEKGTGEFHTGKWCRFCKAKYICRERAKKNLELAAFEFTTPPLLTDEEISDILSKIDALIAWTNDVKEYALQEAVDGKHWPHFKLVEGRSVRKYTDEAAVAAAATAAGFDPYDKKLRSISEMEKQMGKKRFQEILGTMVTKPAGKPALVGEDDKRPELQINDINEFKEDN